MASAAAAALTLRTGVLACRWMEPIADAELVRRISSGEDAAAAESELCRRFAPRVFLYGLKHLRDEDLARDLVQTVLLSVLVAARAGRIVDPSRADRYMLGASRNLAARMRDREARSAGDEALADLPAPLPDDGVADPIELGALFRCLGRLEERARHIVMLSFQQRKPTDEVAARLALTPGNVRVIRHRAIAALRRCLDAASEALT
jgi:RNA polymerase sigma-70 factor, ECF subfamily